MKPKQAKSHNVQLQNVPAELQAFIYQQIAEFKPFLLPDSSVQFVLTQEEGEAPDQSVFAVRIVLTGEGTFVEAVGRASDIFEATANAKNDLLDHLYAIQNLMINSQAREEQIDLLARGPITIH